MLIHYTLLNKSQAWGAGETRVNIVIPPGETKVNTRWELRVNIPGETTVNIVIPPGEAVFNINISPGETRGNIVIPGF